MGFCVMCILQNILVEGYKLTLGCLLYIYCSLVVTDLLNWTKSSLINFGDLIRICARSVCSVLMLVNEKKILTTVLQK